MGNAHLLATKKIPRDEYYTRLTDIERELCHYERHFRGKTVYCNCDDPFKSKVFEYFVRNFNRLGLKKLIATCYTGPDQQLSFNGGHKERGQAYKAVITRVPDDVELFAESSR